MMTRFKPRRPRISPKLRKQSVYLLPNAFTTAALFAGFFSVLQAMDGNFERAAIAIFIAMILDGMDGRVARMTNTQSAFGAEFDSLSDMVSFGVAPALVAYEWQLRHLGQGKLGWAVAFIYCAAAALRLARFNTQLGVADKRWFQGMPSPTAAALVAGLVWISLEAGWEGKWLAWTSLVVTAFAGLTMVSNVRYYSFKSFNLRGSIPFIGLVLFILIGMVVVYNPPIALFTFFVGYGLSGYVTELVLWLRARGKPQPKTGPTE